MSDADRLKQQDARSYDEVTSTFERFTLRFSEPIAARMIDLAAIESGARVLDVGTGTGVLAFAAAHRAGPSSRVLGIDLSEGMLAASREKAERSGLSPPLSFETHDAEALQIDDASIDCVVSLYAMLHFPHPDRALAEMLRVLKPGGRLVLAIGVAPPFASVTGLAYLARRIPLQIRKQLGRWLVAPDFLDRLVDEILPPVDPSDNLVAEHHSHSISATALTKRIENAGFVGLRAESRAGLGMLATTDEFWELQRTFSSSVRVRIQRAPAEHLTRLERTFHERCQRTLDQGGRLVYPYAAYIVVARRPA